MTDRKMEEISMSMESIKKWQIKGDVESSKTKKTNDSNQKKYVYKSVDSEGDLHLDILNGHYQSIFWRLQVDQYVDHFLVLLHCLSLLKLVKLTN